MQEKRIILVRTKMIKEDFILIVWPLWGMLPQVYFNRRGPDQIIYIVACLMLVFLIELY